MSKNWSSDSTSHSVDSKKGVANHHFAKHFKAKERHSSMSTTECFFCENWTSNNPHFIQNVINKALYLKNFSLQKFFYTKDINDILIGKKNSQTINFKDMQCFYYEKEYLKQVYPVKEYEKRIKRLAEYYKFHQDIPRMFIGSTAKIFSYYHDNKRRIDYFRITKMLNEQTKSRNASPNQEKSLDKKQKNSSIVDKILVGLDDGTQLESRKSSKMISPINFKDKASGHLYQAVQSSKPPRNNGKKYENEKERVNWYEKSDEIKLGQTPDNIGNTSISKSIIELNMKLGEIINRSYSQTLNLDMMSYFDQSHQQLNEKVSALNSIPVEESVKVEKKLSSPRTVSENKKVASSEYYSHAPVQNNQEFDSVKLVYEEENPSPAMQIINSATNQQAFRSSEWFQSLKKAVPPNLIRKKPNRLICTSKERIVQEARKSLSSVKISSDSVTISQNHNHYSAATIAKIKNFEEVLRKKQYNTSADMRQQRSTSREKTYQYPNSSFNEHKSNMQQAAKTHREKSDDNHTSRGRKKIDILKTKIKLSSSNNVTYRDRRLNMFNKHTGSHHYESQQSLPGTSEKDIYTSVNIKDLTQQVNQQGHRYMSSTAQNVKITTKIHSGTGNEEHFKSIPKIPVYQSAKDYRRAQTLASDPTAQPPVQADEKKPEIEEDALVIQGDQHNKNLVFEKPIIRIRCSNENLRRSKALTHREKDYELVPSREVSSEKNKKFAMYILTKKDDHSRVKKGCRNSESPDSEEGKKYNEEHNLRHDKSSKDLTKFFVEQSQGHQMKNQGERRRRAISTEKFRPEMVTSHSQHKLSGIAINSMRDNHEMNKDINNLYEKIYTKYAQGLSLKSVPKEGFIRVKSKDVVHKEGKGFVSTRCVRVDLHNSREVIHVNSIENDKIQDENSGAMNHPKKGKSHRKNTLEI